MVARIDQTDQIGQRVRTWRKHRGLKQGVVADRAGISQGYLSRIERGERVPDRKSVQVALARALDVTVPQLLGQPGDPVDPVRSRAVIHVPAIRATLLQLTVGDLRAPRRTVEQLRGDVQRLVAFRNAADYAAIVPLLPDLLTDLAGHGADTADDLVQALFATRFTLKSMGFADLALTAGDVGQRVGQRCQHPAVRALATYSWVQGFPAESAALGVGLVERTADGLQGETDRDSQEMYGCLHLLAALWAAIGNDRARAAGHLGEATDVAAALGEPQRRGPLIAGFNGNWFGPCQVDYWRVAVAAELGDTGEARTVSDRIDPATIPAANRHVYRWIDLARAEVAGSRDVEALEALALAERAAPQHFRFHPLVPALLRVIIERAQRRAVVPEMTRLARKLGIDPI